MEQPTHSKAVFANLVYGEDGEPVENTFIGTEPYYIIMDGDFKRHVAAEFIDRQVIDWLQGQVSAHKGLVAENIMGLLGQDDLFTKAMIDSSIEHMDEAMAQGLPDDARMMLGMMGFKITVNIHGEVVTLDMPAQDFPGGADDL
jgi:hypothetical protein